MAELLKNLPSRGLLDPEAGPLVGRAPGSYVGDFDSAAPQVVKPTELNVLLASLEKSRAKEAAAKKRQPKADKQPAEERRKRPQREAGSSREAAGAAAAKRQNTGGAGGPPFSPQQLRGKSNQELSALLKDRGLPHTGRKDALVERILNAQQ